MASPSELTTPHLSDVAQDIEALRILPSIGYSLGSFMDDLFNGVITPENAQVHLEYAAAAEDKDVDELIVEVPFRFELDHRNKDVEPRVLEVLGLSVLVAH